MYKKCARQTAEEFDPHNRGHTQGTSLRFGGGGGGSQRIRDGNQIVTLALEERFVKKKLRFRIDCVG